MTRHVKFVACLVTLVFVEVTFTQIASAQASAQAAAVSSPVAYVYVASSPSKDKNEINAYSAAPDGKLTPVAGSPFSAAAGYGASLAVNGKYLFFANQVDIHSYSIASDGALHGAASMNAQGFNQSDCGGPVSLFVDRSGATLYDEDIYSDCANNAYQFFAVASSTGGLTYRGVTAASTPEFEVPLSFLGNNKYAYGASCYHWNQVIFGFVRNSDGALTRLDIEPAIPDAESGYIYCPYLAATDSTDHVAVAMQRLNNSSLQPVGPYQLATYTADNSGNLTTTSAYANMPAASVTNDSDNSLADISISPCGKLLAVAGIGGLEVFHFNGADPVTHYTAPLTTDAINQIFWDNDHHLYAISQSSGKLFVFTVTPTSHSQAAGSPYAITNPEAVVALSK
jgi:hypothetical protein